MTIPLIACLWLDGSGIILFLLLLPFFLFMLMYYQISDSDLRSSVSYSAGLLQNGLGKLFFLFLSLGVVCTLFLLFTDLLPKLLNVEMLGWLGESNAENFIKFQSAIVVFLIMAAQVFILPLFLSGFAALSYNLEELQSARGLRRKLVKAGLIAKK